MTLALILVAAGGTHYWRQYAEGRQKRISGTITRLDLERRTASMQFLHPKSGQMIDLDAEVPADCQIERNGLPIALADLRIGEAVEVVGIVYRTGRVRPLRVTAQPSISAAAHPTSEARSTGSP